MPTGPIATGVTSVAPVMVVPGDRLRGQATRSWIWDGVVTLLALLAAVPSTFAPDPAPAWLAAGVAIAIALPVLVRRVWPLPVFGVMVVIAAVSGWWVPSAVVSLALVIALYTVASRCSRWSALACAAALSAGVVAWTARMYTDVTWWPPAVFLIMIVVATTVLGLYMATRRRLLLELQARAVQLEHERDQQGELAAAAERERIAREMHDIVAHHLTVMVALADGAAAQSALAPDQAGEAMRTVSATGRQALSDTRRLLGVLRTADGSVAALAPLPGLADLDELIAGTRAAGLHVRYEVDGAAPALPPGSQLAVFRLVQEALTNTMKHAGREASASVHIRYRADEVVLDVSDSGPPPGVVRPRVDHAGSGRGLPGMRERIVMTGGHVNSGPSPTGGWVIRARVPAGTGSDKPAPSPADSAPSDPGPSDPAPSDPGPTALEVP